MVRHRLSKRALRNGTCTAAVTAAVAAVCVLVPAELTHAETYQRPTLTFYGTPGLIDLPTAHSAPDGTVFLTSSHVASDFNRKVLAFQATPRLTGAFRYTTGPILEEDEIFDGFFDRGFDVQFRILDETRLRPAVAIGLRDFGGTGIYAGEYIVATKTVTPKVQVTAGLGWGRLASLGGFDNPLGLGARSTGRQFAGAFNAGDYFRGDAAFFGGVEWRPNDRLSFKAEYSSDAYRFEDDAPLSDFDWKSPFNFAAAYQFKNGVDATLAYRYGSELGVMLNYSFDPRVSRFPDGREGAPLAVVPRGDVSSWRGAGLDEEGGPKEVGPEEVGQGGLVQSAAAALAADGIELKTLRLEGGTATLHVVNARYQAAPQALGRAARALTGALPPEIETIVLIPTSAAGLPLSAVTLQRSDLEELEFDLEGAWRSYSRARIGDAAGQPLAPELRLPGAYPQFDWRVGAYLAPAFFDPEAPVRADAGVELAAGWAPMPGIVVSGQVRVPVAGNLGESTRLSNSVLPRVRTDGVLYDRASDVELSYLTAEYFFRPGENLYGRVTAGYLERMYAGISAEVLWKPTQGPLALGAELNYAVQRDFDVRFGLRDYDIVTGHASVYYDFGNGFLGQIDAGRYLAGDWGATFALDREFDNGFSVGAFFTLTDVSAEEFGEGSFDKGIRFTVPVSWLSGDPSRGGFSQAIRPVTRDGGARLNVRNRLHGVVRGSHDPELKEDWGRFWR